MLRGKNDNQIYTCIKFELIIREKLLQVSSRISQVMLWLVHLSYVAIQLFNFILFSVLVSLEETW